MVAPPALQPADAEAAIAAMQKLHDSPAWKAALEKNGWTDFFRTGDDFKAYLDSENQGVEGVLAESVSPGEALLRGAADRVALCWPIRWRF